MEKLLLEDELVELLSSPLLSSPLLSSPLLSSPLLSSPHLTSPHLTSPLLYIFLIRSMNYNTAAHDKSFTTAGSMRVTAARSVRSSAATSTQRSRVAEFIEDPSRNRFLPTINNSIPTFFTRYKSLRNTLVANTRYSR